MGGREEKGEVGGEIKWMDGVFGSFFMQVSFVWKKGRGGMLEVELRGQEKENMIGGKRLLCIRPEDHTHTFS